MVRGSRLELVFPGSAMTRPVDGRSRIVANFIGITFRDAELMKIAHRRPFRVDIDIAETDDYVWITFFTRADGRGNV